MFVAVGAGGSVGIAVSTGAVVAVAVSAGTSVAVSVGGAAVLVGGTGVSVVVDWAGVRSGPATITNVSRTANTPTIASRRALEPIASPLPVARTIHLLFLQGT